MKTCREYETWISELIDGELSQPDRTELSEHMAVCPVCQRYFDDLIAMHDAFDRSLEEPGEGFAPAVMARVRTARQEKPPRKVIAFPHWRRWTALAACCAVAALGIWGLRDAGLPVMDAAPQAAPASLAPRGPEGEQAEDGGGAYAGTEADEEELPASGQEGEAAGDVMPMEADIGGDEPEPEDSERKEDLTSAGDRENLAEPVLPEDDAGTEKRTEGTEDPAPDGLLAAAQPPADGTSAPSEKSETPDAPETAPEPAHPEGGDALELDASANEAVSGGQPEEETPESGVVTAFGSAARQWVEQTLQLEWESGRSYPLTAGQYADLLRTLREAGESFQLEEAEGYCLMAQ